MLTHTKLKETEFIFLKPQSDFSCNDSFSHCSAGLKVLLQSKNMRQVKAPARNIKAAGMRRVSVEGAAHAPKHAK